jgi:thymidylate synthase ThyX
MTTQITGTNGISATIIQDSINEHSNRITTFEIEYPRFILSELNTHRMLSKNSASSRAIPIQKMHEHVRENTATPINWGRNRAGMQATEELRATERKAAQGVWTAARDQALSHASVLNQIGLHKQVANRITEPFMMMKTVITGTEWANFFWLRDHADAQPEIANLAYCMRLAMERSVPQVLRPGEWHVPYVVTHCDRDGYVWYSDNRGTELTVEQALIISASCCAQVSYRKNDDTLEKAQEIFHRLITSEPIHASPIEHQATPMSVHNARDRSSSDPEWGYRFQNPETWGLGITHMDRNYDFWSGNFKGWIQHRKTLQNEAKW